MKVKRIFRQAICVCLVVFAFVLAEASAQSVFAERSVKSESLNVTKPPEISSIPAANFPEIAPQKGN